MKRFLIILTLFLNTGCVRFMATGSDVVDKTSRLNRTIGQVKYDLALESELVESIEKDRNYILAQTNSKKMGRYNIDVLEGRVLISGVVNNLDIKAYMISKIAENLKVREILDEIRIAKPKHTKIKDFFLRRTLISKIFLKSKIRSLNYEISVIEGYVGIIGIAEDEAEAELIAKIVSTVRGVKEVNSYIITKDSNKKLKTE